LLWVLLYVFSFAEWIYRREAAEKEMEEERDVLAA